MEIILISITSSFRIQKLILLQANRCQSTLAPDAGILEVPEQNGNLCRNDYRVDRDCSGDISVEKAGEYCSACTVSGFPM